MAGVPAGQQRINFNVTNELQRDLVIAQKALGCSMSALLRQALIDFLAKALPQEVILASNAPRILHLRKPIGQIRPRNILELPIAPVDSVSEVLTESFNDPVEEGIRRAVVPIHVETSEDEEEDIPDYLR